MGQRGWPDAVRVTEGWAGELRLRRDCVGLLRTSQAGRDIHWLRESRDRGEGLLILPAEPWLPHPSGACFVRLIYKCSCEMVFNKKRHFQQHFYQNVSKSQAGVFKCPECPLLFLQKPELMQHVKVRCPGRSLGGSAEPRVRGLTLLSSSPEYPRCSQERG